MPPPLSSDSGRAARGNGRQEHRNEDDDEEGEIHPLVTLTKIDPSEIPEVKSKAQYLRLLSCSMESRLLLSLLSLAGLQ